eukprot:Nitzschia sp. Nitz4//scaffold47_size129522//14299//15711//NITZ4_003536-RA/size129522-processed-gene-0.130-mRNA-1//1//CDS//3329552755//8239//frame0
MLAKTGSMRWTRAFPILSPCVLTHSFLTPLPCSLLQQQQQQHHGWGTATPSSTCRSSPIHNTPRRYQTTLASSWEAEPLSSFVSPKDLPSNLTLAPTPDDVLTLQDNQRLVCMGDIHGDASALLECLELAGVIGKTNYRPGFPIYPTWTGGDTILVQIGDILDRGYYDLHCMQILCDLSHQAQKSGGKVICLLGNHEIMNVVGDFSYVAEDTNWMFQHAVGTLVDQTLPLLQNGKSKNATRSPWRVQYHCKDPDRNAAFEPNGILSHSVLANMKVAVQVGRTLCVHAGLVPEHLQKHGGVSGINSITKSYIMGDFMKGENFKFNNVANYEDVVQESYKHAYDRKLTYYNNIPELLAGSDSPVFLREFSSPPDVQKQGEESLKKLGDVLQSESCDRMVMGHTPQAHANAIFEGKAWRIDTGMSSSVGRFEGAREVLEIVQRNGKEVVHVLTRDGRVPGDERTAPAHSDLIF